MVGLVFRTIGKDDAVALYELLNGLSTEASSFFHPHSFDLRTVQEICSNSTEYYFVLYLEDVLIGYSMLRLCGHAIPMYGGCIRKGYEGRRYGMILLERTLLEAKKLGFQTVRLKVQRENARAYQLYAKAGFHETGIEENNIVMSLDLHTMPAIRRTVNRP